MWSAKTQIPPIGAPRLTTPLHGVVQEVLYLWSKSVGTVQVLKLYLHMYVLGQRVNGEVLISNWPWSNGVPLGPSCTNIPFKKLLMVFRPHCYLRPPIYISYGKDWKLKIWILFLQGWSKSIPIYLKGTPKTFNEKFEVFYVPHGSQMWKKLPFLTKNSHLGLKMRPWSL